MIKDSGERREFDTGAVRDIREGKGRCDLLPLMVVAKQLVKPTEMGFDIPLYNIASFVKSNDTAFLHMALAHFAIQHYDSSPETMILEVSKHFEEGAKKYGENNWQKGLPVNCYIDSAIRHYLKHRRGDNDEPHDRAFVWNILCCIWEVDYHAGKAAAYGEVRVTTSEVADHIITNGVTIPVRCKDCKHYNVFRLECHNKYMNGCIGINGFCSYGERRTTND